MSDEREKDKDQEKEKGKGTEQGGDDSVDLIKELGVLGSGGSFQSDYQYLSIIGCVEGHMVMSQENKTTKYEHLIPELIAVEENPKIKGLLLILNTVGGDVEAGLALAELIAGISKPTVSLVIGGGHSIGIPLAVSTDYSFVAKSATMTLHPIRTSGTLITAEPTFSYMKKTQERVVDFIVEHSHAKESVINEKMNCTSNMANDVGTLLFGPEAVEIGLIDEIGSLTQALAKLKEMVKDAEEKEEQEKD
ncbi:MAG: translocation-enhancing protein TepA [Firmicutes bacterium]|jgi:ATP-dependent protease ClpP protease subunit|nr:translocation-enhancing protein TepA [Bacillota bacterium]